MDVVYFADSTGSLNREQTQRIVRNFKKSWDGDLGVHAHDNMDMAMENAMIALNNGTNWIDSTVQKNPSDADYQLIGTVSPNQPNFTVDVVLKAPGGKTLWSESYGASLRQINQLGDTVANTISEKVFMEIMKVRDKSSKS